MIEGYDNYQLELFNEARGSLPKRPLGSRFFNFLHRHEKKFLIVIGVAVSCIISFSLGVIKGRELSVSRGRASFDLAQKKTVIKAAAAVATPAKEAEEQLKLDRQEKALAFKQPAGGYTIQLASYKGRQSADKEADTLKKKGLTAFVVYKGDYVILCAGKFSDKEQARNSMSKLKKQYKDCILRRL